MEQDLTGRADAIEAIETNGDGLVEVARVGDLDDVFARTIVNDSRSKEPILVGVKGP